MAGAFIKDSPALWYKLLVLTLPHTIAKSNILSALQPQILRKYWPPKPDRSEMRPIFSIGAEAGAGL
jgi:hypothetical protein